MSEQLASRTTSSRRRVAPFVAMAIAVGIAGLFFVLARTDPDRTDSANSRLIGRYAPAAVGPLDDGGTFNLAQRKGSWVVLNFFDSTCVPCVEEHPELVAFAEGHARSGSEGGARGGSGAELVTIVWGQHPDGARRFFADNGGDWPIVFDDGSIAAGFGVTRVPETWIIDPSGRVVWRRISTVTAQQLNQALADLDPRRAAG